MYYVKEVNARASGGVNMCKIFSYLWKWIFIEVTWANTGVVGKC